MPTLSGQVAIISGGLGDIGRAIALELARRGAAIALGDLHEQASGPAEFLTALHHANVPVRYDHVDVADAQAVGEWFATVEADLGVPTLIVPNAARVTLADCRAIEPEQWSAELRVNLDGAFYVAQAGAKRLLAASKPGRIVFVGSWAAHAPHVHIPAYCAAKAGLRMLCRCLALELAPYHILVNEVAPGQVDAGLSAQVFAAEPERRRIAESGVPVGRLITASEVAAQVAYLCEPTNSQMTGSTLLMDGGLSLLAGPR
jgi:glucose 1-dehydrogenase